MASIASLTRQMSSLDVSGKNKPTTTTTTTTSSARPPLHSKQPSQTNVAKLLTKFAAPHQTNLPAKITKTASSSTLRSQSAQSTEKPPPEKQRSKADTLEIGAYDGGLDNDTGGAAISAEAEKHLAVDSSVAVCVSTHFHQIYLRVVQPISYPAMESERF